MNGSEIVAPSPPAIPLKHDVRSAMVLSGAFAVLAATAVPLLLDVLPAAARDLPLPLPLFCAALALQLFIVYGVFPDVLHPPSVLAALAASAAGAFGEEILFRLCLISLLLRMFRKLRMGAAIAIGLSAILFALAHGPALVYVSGGIDRVPLVTWIWIVGLNGAVAVPYGVLFLRYGIGAAILAHLGTGLVWHVASQLTT